MTRSETVQILSILRKAYPVFYKDITKREAEDIVDLWHTMFEDDDLLLVINAVKAFIATDDKGYPPVIGVIKKKMREISQPVAMTEFEVWDYIKKAVSNSLYNSKEEYDKLPPTIQSLVGSHDVLREWSLIDTSKFDTVVQPNFMRSYKARCEREKEIMALPLSVREFSNKIVSTMRMDRLLE
jgi:hypothetical protein